MNLHIGFELECFKLKCAAEYKIIGNEFDKKLKDSETLFKNYEKDLNNKIEDIRKKREDELIIIRRNEEIIEDIIIGHNKEIKRLEENNKKIKLLQDIISKEHDNISDYLLETRSEYKEIVFNILEKIEYIKKT